MQCSRCQSQASNCCRSLFVSPSQQFTTRSAVPSPSAARLRGLVLSVLDRADNDRAGYAFRKRTVAPARPEGHVGRADALHVLATLPHGEDETADCAGPAARPRSAHMRSRSFAARGFPPGSLTASSHRAMASSQNFFAASRSFRSHSMRPRRERVSARRPAALVSFDDFWTTGSRKACAARQSASAWSSEFRDSHRGGPGRARAPGRSAEMPPRAALPS